MTNTFNEQIKQCLPMLREKYAAVILVETFPPMYGVPRTKIECLQLSNIQDLTLTDCLDWVLVRSTPYASDGTKQQRIAVLQSIIERTPSGLQAVLMAYKFTEEADKYQHYKFRPELLTKMATLENLYQIGIDFLQWNIQSFYEKKIEALRIAYEKELNKKWNCSTRINRKRRMCKSIYICN